MSTQSSTTIPVFLNQSPKTDRYYFAAQSFKSTTIKDFNGDAFETLSPVGNSDLRNLPSDAIRSSILPIEWNSLSRADVVAKVGASALIDYTTGKLTLVPPTK